MRDQIAAFDQFDTHLAGEVGVLEISRVEDARRKQHNVRLRAPFGRERAQRAQQQLRVLLDRLDLVAGEELGKDALHHAPVGEHVAHARRHAQVVFEHDEVAVLHADEVGAAHGHVHVSRHLQPDHLAAKVFAAINDLARHDTVGENAAFVVDVAQKHVQRGNALGQAGFHLFPLGMGDDAWQQVVGKDLFGAFLAPVDCEGDALVEEAEVGGLFAALQVAFGQGCEMIQQRFIVLVQRLGPGEHLIVGVVQQIVLHCRPLEGLRMRWNHWRFEYKRRAHFHHLAKSFCTFRKAMSDV